MSKLSRFLVYYVRKVDVSKAVAKSRTDVPVHVKVVESESKGLAMLRAGTKARIVVAAKKYTVKRAAEEPGTLTIEQIEAISAPPRPSPAFATEDIPNAGGPAEQDSEVGDPVAKYEFHGECEECGACDCLNFQSHPHPSDPPQAEEEPLDPEKAGRALAIIHAALDKRHARLKELNKMVTSSDDLLTRNQDEGDRVRADLTVYAEWLRTRVLALDALAEDNGNVVPPEVLQVNTGLIHDYIDLKELLAAHIDTLDAATDFIRAAQDEQRTLYAQIRALNNLRDEFESASLESESTEPDPERNRFARGTVPGDAREEDDPVADCWDGDQAGDLDLPLTCEDTRTFPKCGFGGSLVLIGGNTAVLALGALIATYSRFTTQQEWLVAFVALVAALLGVLLVHTRINADGEPTPND